MYDAFKKHLEGLDSSPNTIRNYTTDLKMAQRHGIITENLASMDLKKLVNLDVKPRTKQRMRAAIRRYARFCAGTGIISQVPAELTNLDLPKITRNIPRVTRSGKAKELLAKIDDAELSLIIHLLATTGCRISSLADLEIEDFGTKSVLFRTSKGGKPYVSILTPDTKEAFLKHIKHRASGYVFLTNADRKATPDSLRGKLYAGLGEDYVNPHSFRHGVATELIENGVDLTVVKTFMNHTSVTVTETYVHLADEYIVKKLKGKHPMLSDSVD